MNTTRINYTQLRKYSGSLNRTLLDINYDCDERVEKIRKKYANRLKNSILRRHEDWQSIFGKLLEEFEDERKREKQQKQENVDHNDEQSNDQHNDQSNGLSNSQSNGQSNYQSNYQSIDQSNDLQHTDIILDDIDQEENNGNEKNTENPTILSKAVEDYTFRLNVLESTRDKLKFFTTDSNLAKYKNDLQLLVRTQINTISSGSRENLADKVHKFTCLFGGKPVKYQDRLIDTQRHENAALFCLELAASSFVTAATKQVNSVPGAANSMAMIIALLIDKFPLFKVLVTAHIQQRCPYTVPIIPCLEAGMSEIEFKITCGYAYSSKNTLESQENYELRMRAICLLYSAILKHTQISQAWQWLAGILNFPPDPVITATVIEAALQESGEKLLSMYGRQFRKLIQFIDETYIPMIETAIKKKEISNRQSLVKLKILIDEIRPKLSITFSVPYQV